MHKLKMRIVYQGVMPTKADIKTIIADRIMRRSKEPIHNTSDGNDWDEPEWFDANHDNATLVTSMVEGSDRHMPVIDLDLECALVPSSQPGNFHLYINRQMTWEQYVNILKALEAAGVVQTGYLFHTERRGYGSVRYPGVTKSNEQARIDYWEDA